MRDIRYGLRSLLKRPGSTLVALVTLALGIGVNTAIFSAVDSVLLRPLPLKDPERLVSIWERSRARELFRPPRSESGIREHRSPRAPGHESYRRRRRAGATQRRARHC
jgi:hypothetical protein